MRWYYRLEQKLERFAIPGISTPSNFARPITTRMRTSMQVTRSRAVGLTSINVPVPSRFNRSGFSRSPESGAQTIAGATLPGFATGI